MQLWLHYLVYIYLKIKHILESAILDIIIICTGSQDGVVTGYGLSDLGIMVRFPMCSLERPERLWGSIQCLVLCAPGVKLPGSDFNHSPPSSAEAKNKWGYSSAPSIHLHEVHSCNSTFFTVFTASKYSPIRYIYTHIFGPGSSVGIATDYRLDGPGIESRWRSRFSTPIQTGPRAHLASCTMGTGSFPGVKYGRGVTLTTHPLLVPLSWKSRTIPLPTLWATPSL
jgi:hypothetical protein